MFRRLATTGGALSSATTKRAITLTPFEMIRNTPLSPVTSPMLDPKPEGDKRHTLVLDIDETLIHTYRSDMTCETALRPHVIEFLREVDALYELVFWTAGVEAYGQAVLKSIEEAGKQLDGKSVIGEKPTAFYRQHTIQKLNWMKYLGHLGRPVQNCLLIDDNQRSFPLTPRSGITCKPFHATFMKDEGQRTQESPLEYYQKTHNKDYNHKDGVAVPWKHLVPPPVELPEEVIGDKELMNMMPMLRAVAKAETAIEEMDHWRPDGYEKTDDVLQDYYQSGVGDWVNERRANGPVEPMSQKFVESFNKLPQPVIELLLAGRK